VNLQSAWAAGTKNLSESDIVLALAAEAGVPVVFVSGDDALGADLAPTVPYVVTKTALSPAAARSLPTAEVHEQLRRAAAAAPVAAPDAIDGPWRLRFKSRWAADLAVAAGGRPTADGVLVTGDGARARYAQALRLLSPLDAPYTRALRTFKADVFVTDAVAALGRGFERTPPPSVGAAAQRALAAFLARTEAATDEARALRALTLHMLEGHAPDFFRAAGLGPVTADACRRLADVSVDLPAGLPPRQAMDRLDAAYVCAERGVPHRRLDGLPAYVRTIHVGAPLFAWLLWEIGRQIGLCPRVQFPTRPLRPARIADLYWLTHLFLLETRYLRRRFEPAGWGSEIEELLLATPETLANGWIDLVGELAICLQLAGEDDSAEHGRLLAALLAAQHADGAILDGHAPKSDAHATAAGLLALARYA
jgi:D-amino peptidase